MSHTVQPLERGNTKYIYKNKLNHLIKIAKKTYNEFKFQNAKSDFKHTWRLINEVINTGKKKAAYSFL